MNPDDKRSLTASARAALEPYGRDYALGAVKGLAVRNMVAVELPPTSRGFYPVAKIHEMAVRDLEEVFYGHLLAAGGNSAQEMLSALVEGRVWEREGGG